MSKDKDGIAQQNDASSADAKATDDSSAEAKRSKTNTGTKEEELEEGLEESMSGSEAPASTRRSNKD